jgi:hypothetical protein
VLVGDDWQVVEYTVVIQAWPNADEFTRSLEKTLRDMVSAGALVAWAAFEGYFTEPPLLEQRVVEGGVYAVYHPKLGYIIHASLRDPVRTLSLAEASALKRVVYPAAQSSAPQ